MNKFERCLWIVSTLNDYGKASLRELNDRWIDSSLNYEGEEISARTFARDKEFIATTFQLDIEYDTKSRKYVLANAEDLQSGSLYKYLLGSFHVNMLTNMTVRHRDKVMVQDVNTGVEWLSVMLDAIERGHTVCFDYVSYYNKEKTFHYEVIPCFVRLFEHRWYVVCEYLDHSQTRVLALERMTGVEVGQKKAVPSRHINPTEFYAGCFGVIRDDKQPTVVLLKVFDKQVDYVRSLPIHPSQKEVETGEGYAVFSYYLRPSFDFVQHLLWQKKVEVLAPLSLREEMIRELNEMLGRYK